MSRLELAPRGSDNCEKALIAVLAKLLVDCSDFIYLCWLLLYFLLIISALERLDSDFHALHFLPLVASACVLHFSTLLALSFLCRASPHILLVGPSASSFGPRVLFWRGLTFLAQVASAFFLVRAVLSVASSVVQCIGLIWRAIRGLFWHARVFLRTI